MKCVKVPSSVRCHSFGTPAAMFARLPGIVVSAQRLPFVSVSSLHSSTSSSHVSGCVSGSTPAFSNRSRRVRMGMLRENMRGTGTP